MSFLSSDDTDYTINDIEIIEIKKEIIKFDNQTQTDNEIQDNKTFNLLFGSNGILFGKLSLYFLTKNSLLSSHC